MTVRDIADDVLDAVAHAWHGPLGEPDADAPTCDLDGALLEVHGQARFGEWDRKTMQQDTGSILAPLTVSDAARTVVSCYDLEPAALRRLAAVGLAALVAWHAEPLEAFGRHLKEMPDDMLLPLRVGEFATGPEASGFARARWLIDATGRRVGVVDSDEGPALVGPLDVLAVAILVEEGRLRWLS